MDIFKTPPPCAPDVYEHGTPVMVIAGPRSQTIEDWIVKIRESTGQQVDWHYIAGRAVVRALGDLDLVCMELRNRTDDLVDAYMACPCNHTDNPERSDVSWRFHDEVG